jgi:hypothetical protein
MVVLAAELSCEVVRSMAIEAQARVPVDRRTAGIQRRRMALTRFINV